MKKIMYSTPLKFVACILCALSVAMGAYIFTTNFINNNNIYLFENSYEESYKARNDIETEFYSLIRGIENTQDKDGKIQMDKFAKLPSADELEYYIKIDNKVYSNVKNQSYEDFENSPLSYGARYTKGEKHNEGFSNPGGGIRYYSGEIENDYEICLRMPQSVIEQNSKQWLILKENCDKALTQIIILLILSLITFAYMLCVTGKTYNEKEIKFMLIDRMFVEITLGLLLFVAIGGSALVIITIYSLFNEYISAVNMLIAFLTFATIELSLILFLSLVRNVKNKTFLKKSLIVCIYLFIWNTIKKLFSCIKRGIIGFKNGVLTIVGKKFSGKFLGLILVGYTLVLVVLTCLCFANLTFALLLVLFVAVSFVFVCKRLIGFENLKKGIEIIKNGDLNYKITDCPVGVIGEMADNVNSIGDGLQKSLENEVKAERMKSELITNVSHDLKTPLTSIINYVDLLSKETLIPNEANDYVAIIKLKSERLKQLTNDLFDISKVQSGNEEFNFENIDVNLLINQTLAEMNEDIKESELDFRVTTNEKEVFIEADGRKMSRVFENLLVNCLKYSMKNTRVYIDVIESDTEICVEIKNIAGYDMDFDEEEIAERFVRGDSSRSTEGSGLGLAIVKSYVEGCGGTVDIKKDGDLFKVIIRFEK